MDSRGFGYFEGRILVEPMDAFMCIRELFAYITLAGLRINVPAGFLTDGASVPKMFWNLMSPFDKRWFGAAIVHDLLYCWHMLSREDADHVLVEAANCDDITRGILYRAVRRFGGRAYETGPARQDALKKRMLAMGLS